VDSKVRVEQMGEPDTLGFGGDPERLAIPSKLNDLGRRVPKSAASAHATQAA
jgi:hypothetical protein